MLADHTVLGLLPFFFFCLSACPLPSYSPLRVCHASYERPSMAPLCPCSEILLLSSDLFHLLSFLTHLSQNLSNTLEASPELTASRGHSLNAPRPGYFHAFFRSRKPCLSSVTSIPCLFLRMLFQDPFKLCGRALILLLLESLMCTSVCPSRQNPKMLLILNPGFPIIPPS